MDRTQRRLTVALSAGALVIAVVGWQWVGRTPAVAAGTWSWARQDAPASCSGSGVGATGASLIAVEPLTPSSGAVAEVPVVNHDRFPVTVGVAPVDHVFRLALAESLVPEGPGLDFTAGSPWLTRSADEVTVPPGRAAVVQVWVDPQGDVTLDPGTSQVLRAVTVTTRLLGVRTTHEVPLGSVVVVHGADDTLSDAAVCAAAS
ncbi:hypothetical protein [Luteimicrobium subarcticum]|uniref:Uncharacterized protein n=1 Tax=Luteimicrobium subarcticum TaxID=620910 RepID=A0A2M8WW61_9MICO|nr:hypothetical protein [Luteimicrobium subarcticum]PJI95162.1 hypothetical protein CLV34_1018 [Luteimicrobium subarcticum]